MTNRDRVTVLEMGEGNPSLLVFYSVLTLRNGAEKRCGQVVRVDDSDLWKRLHAEVKPGDTIRVYTILDETVTECPTALEDFCRL